VPATLTRRQKEIIEANRQAGRPIFGERPLGPCSRPVRKLCFASRHCVIDAGGGAAVSTCEALRLLGIAGLQTSAFCGSWLDTPEDIHVSLTRHDIAYETELVTIDGHRLEMLSAQHGSLPVKVAVIDGWTPAELTAFYKAYGRYLDAERPDAVIAYGGDPASATIVDLAKNRDIPVVFWLRNFNYEGTEPFKSVDYVVVPSEFSRQFYWNTLGLACHRLPQVVDPQRVLAARQGRQHVTIVNPQTSKGVYIFARIAEVLARQRPDIPLLVVEGRAKGKQLGEVLPKGLFQYHFPHPLPLSRRPGP
jgi:UDP-N-acetylglucosamine:LPS N-acetylglucosamine transferase